MQVAVVDFAVGLVSVKELTQVVERIYNLDMRIGTDEPFKRLNDSTALKKRFQVRSPPRKGYYLKQLDTSKSPWSACAMTSVSLWIITENGP